MRNLIIAAGLLTSLLGTRGAFAQDAAASGSSSTSTSTSSSGSSQANVGVSLPGASSTTTAATTGSSDHDQMVGRLAVGYFGIANTGAGANFGMAGPAVGANDSPYGITGVAPVVGIRYWLNPMIGIDVGLGMSIVGGSSDDGDPNTPNPDRQSFSAFLIHAGVPLALASASHFTFEVIPELNVGFAGSTADDPNVPGDISSSGFHFDLGARAGAEVSFGFMNLPQLSLVGSVGVRFDSDKGSTENDENMAQTKVKYSTSRSEFHTTVGSNPWAIFTNQVAALYYF